MMNVAVKYRPGTAAYSTGRDTVERIIDAARSMAIEHGFQRLSMRTVARAARISPGNLSYYYATRHDLLEDLLQDVIEGYIQQFAALRERLHDCPEDQFRAVLGFVFDDLSTKATTLFFPELWVLANRDTWAAEQMERVYGPYRQVLEEIIAEINPDLAARQIEDLALVISASVEGHTVFIGHNRPHRVKASRLKKVVVENFLELVKRS